MNLSYVLVTPAHNEEKHIEKTIRSVVSQTVLPKKWVVVSDGSTDRTEEIVRSYAVKRPWMELVCLPKGDSRNFAAKAHAFNAGYERVKRLEYEVIGNLDADVSFESDFFEYLLGKFAEMPGLGVAGTDYIEGTFHSFKDSYINPQHVNGQCQLFRRACFEQIGGYAPIKAGGIDWVAVTTARMKGWDTRSFPDRVYVHHAPMGRTYGSRLAARYNYGRKDYLFGGHPLWEVLRGAFQMTRKPYVVGGVCLLAGYFGAWLKGVQRPVSRELVDFYRQEQMQRLKRLIGNKFKLCR